MKKLIVCLFPLLALVGCQDAVQQVAGAYSYKISGTATVNGLDRTLSDEIGALEIVHVTADTALLTFNVLNGPAYYTRATIKGKTITLVPYERDIHIGASDYHVIAKGTGDIYDRTIVIKLQYNSSNVKANNLTLLCKKN